MCNPETIRDAVRQGIADALGITPEEHRRQHFALERFIVLTTRIDDIKWSVLQKMVIALISGIAILAAYGAMVKIKAFEFFTGWGG